MKEVDRSERDFWNSFVFRGTRHHEDVPSSASADLLGTCGEQGLDVQLAVREG